MSDYKELLRLSEKSADAWRDSNEYYQAALLIDSLCEAIETLMAERDALLDAAHGSCYDCAYYKTKMHDEPCVKCYYSLQYFSKPTIDAGLSDCWQWRGMGGSDGT